jgi:hypothetical protein
MTSAATTATAMASLTLAFTSHLLQEWLVDAGRGQPRRRAPSGRQEA